MQLECPNCKQVLEFTDKRPAFCSHCGQALTDSNVHAAATLPYTPPGSTAGGDLVMSGERPKAVGQYRLLRELGQGGMGVVYEAEHEASGRRVALKLLTPGLAQSGESMERFVREGRLAAALSHPRSTFVYEAGEHAGQPYITMELMPGRTLHHVSADEGPLPVARAVDYMLDVIDGLEAAHKAGVIHRDVKPSNCFLDSDGRVKVGDFGLSKSLVSDAGLTRTGAFMGTPLFAAPEQVRAGKIDTRTDIYAVGATLFYLIARRGPFTGDPAAVIAQISSDPAPSLRGLCPAVPRDLDRVVARTLEKAAERRYATVAELREALLPFSSRGLAQAPLGRRLGAYFIDTMLTGFIGGMIVGVCVVLSLIAHGNDEPVTVGATGVQANAGAITTLLLTLGQFGFFVTTIVYFASLEGRTGRSLGKRLLGLRVVGADAGRPGVWRAAVRSLFVPGLMWLSMTLVIPLLFPKGVTSAVAYDPERALLNQTLQQLAFVPMLACLATMRASNGYMGVHDKISRTRVVILRAQADRPAATEWPVLAAVASGDGTTFGPYRLAGSLGRSGDSVVFQARDETLNRRVWIYSRPNDRIYVDPKRASVARHARPRWLQGGDSDGRRWDAFEAVVGAPISEVALPGASIPWERGRTILRDLAEEMATALGEATLAAAVTVDHIWVDREGHVKLLDAPLQPEQQAPAADSPATQAPVDSAVATLRAAAQLCTRGQLLPAHAQEFMDELAARPSDRATIDWAAMRLRELVDQVGTLRWSDRLVSIGVSLGAEYPFYQAVLSLIAFGILKLPGLSDVGRVLSTLSIAIALPAAFAFAFAGGPVFRFVGIAVRRGDGRAAGRLRCAWRSFLAWFPMMSVFTLNVALLPFVVGQGDKVRFKLDPETSFGNGPGDSMLLFSSASGLLMILFAMCLAYAVTHPQRGVQDMLAGTRLVPR